MLHPELAWMHVTLQGLHRTFGNAWMVLEPLVPFHCYWSSHSLHEMCLTTFEHETIRLIYTILSTFFSLGW
uniref:Uncharacterized protein MANES_04G140400 n=1 Tax=Rhizophora mucronata TaxID=61149 RepID=A0A2P2KVR8_RHIMU